jgi:hypothetical protein
MGEGERNVANYYLPLHTDCFADYRTVPCTEVGKAERKGAIGNEMAAVRVRARHGQGVGMGRTG